MEDWAAGPAEDLRLRAKRRIANGKICAEVLSAVSDGQTGVTKNNSTTHTTTGFELSAARERLDSFATGLMICSICDGTGDAFTYLGQ